MLSLCIYGIYDQNFNFGDFDLFLLFHDWINFILLL